MVIPLLLYILIMQQVPDDQITKIVIKKKPKPIVDVQSNENSTNDQYNHQNTLITDPQTPLASENTSANGANRQHQRLTSPTVSSTNQPVTQGTSSNKRLGPDDSVFKLPAVKKHRLQDPPKDVLTMLNSTYKGVCDSWRSYACWS